METTVRFLYRIVSLMLLDNRRATVLGLILGACLNLLAQILAHFVSPRWSEWLMRPVVFLEIVAVGLLICHFPAFVRVFRKQPTIDDPTDRLVEAIKIGRARGLSSEDEKTVVLEMVNIHLNYLRQANRFSIAELKNNSTPNNRGTAVDRNKDGDGDSDGSSLAEVR